MVYSTHCSPCDNSTVSLRHIKPFLPKRGVYLDGITSAFNEFRYHRWWWEQNYQFWVAEYGGPIANILKVLALPDEVINAAANRLYKQSGPGFGVAHQGLSIVEMEIIAAVILNKPQARIQLGGSKVPLYTLFCRATSLSAKQRSEQQSICTAVQLFA